MEFIKIMVEKDAFIASLVLNKNRTEGLRILTSAVIDLGYRLNFPIQSIIHALHLAHVLAKIGTIKHLEITIAQTIALVYELVRNLYELPACCERALNHYMCVVMGGSYTKLHIDFLLAYDQKPGSLFKTGLSVPSVDAFTMEFVLYLPHMFEQSVLVNSLTLHLQFIQSQSEDLLMVPNRLKALVTLFYIKLLEFNIDRNPKNVDHARQIKHEIAPLLNVDFKQIEEITYKLNMMLTNPSKIIMVDNGKTYTILENEFVKLITNTDYLTFL